MKNRKVVGKVVRLYVEDEMSLVDIASRFWIAPKTVKRWLAEKGIPSRPSNHNLRGSKSPNWKGGNRNYLCRLGYNVLNKAGIDMLRCMKCKDMFVRLEVHHEDKDRHNNGIKNLELLCRRCHFSRHYPEIREGYVRWRAQGGNYK